MPDFPTFNYIEQRMGSATREDAQWRDLINLEQLENEMQRRIRGYVGQRAPLAIAKFWRYLQLDASPLYRRTNAVARQIKATGTPLWVA